MGGNDILPCARETDPDRARACAEEQMPKVRQNLDALLARVRATVGPSVPIVGVSYMNVLLADQLSSDPQIQARAANATNVFQNYLNPVLAQTYQQYGARFVDTTALAGGYLPDTEKTSLPGHGTVPASVGRICALTYYCTYEDIHPNRDGHALIAREIEKSSGE
jgi:lysophospholipase L1-like esterase